MIGKNRHTSQNENGEERMKSFPAPPIYHPPLWEPLPVNPSPKKKKKEKKKKKKRK